MGGHYLKSNAYEIVNKLLTVLLLWLLTIITAERFLCFRNRGDSSPSALISTVTKSALPAPPEVEKRSGGADDLDLRRHNLFKSWPQLECCPTITEKVARHSGINQQGLVLELFNSPAFNQTFYETHCHPEIRGRACQFIDGRIARASRCTQQHTYVYAVGRPYGRRQLQFRFDYIRIASGCKCLLDKKALWMMKN